MTKEEFKKRMSTNKYCEKCGFIHKNCICGLQLSAIDLQYYLKLFDNNRVIKKS